MTKCWCRSTAKIQGRATLYNGNCGEKRTNGMEQRFNSHQPVASKTSKNIKQQQFLPLQVHCILYFHLSEVLIGAKSLIEMRFAYYDFLLAMNWYVIDPKIRKASAKKNPTISNT